MIWMRLFEAGHLGRVRHSRMRLHVQVHILFVNSSCF
jgi:hypothetical protein